MTLPKSSHFNILYESLPNGYFSPVMEYASSENRMDALLNLLGINGYSVEEVNHIPPVVTSLCLVSSLLWAFIL
ncbi:hypothetical protein TNCV_5067821 [Trichonephila clavipes]|uniref:Uncharacterized protein n=1 Tax=Trichonephila clavipes TaxID=2585209 RepID=A0A8X6R932_TRICX|nr:hypothetical protein TNCV_5067821 [Trichonephila clavipes]